MARELITPWLHTFKRPPQDIIITVAHAWCLPGKENWKQLFQSHTYFPLSQPCMFPRSGEFCDNKIIRWLPGPCTCVLFYWGEPKRATLWENRCNYVCIFPSMWRYVAAHTARESHAPAQCSKVDATIRYRSIRQHVSSTRVIAHKSKENSMATVIMIIKSNRDHQRWVAKTPE